MVRAAAFFSLVLVAAGAAGAGISGVASGTDAGTLKGGSVCVRLHGIGAPAAKLRCGVGAAFVRLGNCPGDSSPQLRGRGVQWGVSCPHLACAAVHTTLR